LFVSHDAKGNAGDRRTTDRGAGSSWAGRDYDFRFTLTPHGDENAQHIVLAGDNRNRAAFQPVTLVFNEHSMTFAAAPDIAPVVQTSKTKKTAADKKDKAEKNAAEDADFEALAVSIARTEGTPMLAMGEYLKKLGHTTVGSMGENARRAKLKPLFESGKIVKQNELERKPNGGYGNKKNGRVYIGTPERVASYRKPFETTLGL